MTQASLLDLIARPRHEHLAGQEQADAADALRPLIGPLYPASIAAGQGVAIALARKGPDKELVLLFDPSAPPAAAADFKGRADDATFQGRRLKLVRCLRTPDNANALRKHFDFARPRVLGTATSAGMGDRLGLATPAHLRAVGGSGVLPVVAQQSIREMGRTGRSPIQVVDDAAWGVVEAGWSQPWGADADHLKTFADIDATAAAGFRMFTIDPGEHVDDAADSDDGPTCRTKYDRLPWDKLETAAADTREFYQDRRIRLGGDLAIEFTETDVKKAAVKYGRAIAHTVAMHRHLVEVMGDVPFELEMSVDETSMATSPQEHYFVAHELRRLGVRPVSLAPRFVGRFEKGVDYQGDINEFRRQFALHAAIARELGPYKLSLHSGSDKFSIYPIAAELAGGLIHLKTAGTSYLEAIRAVARVCPALFREILAFAIERYEQDKASYHVSAELAKVARPEDLADSQLAAVLDDFHSRQVLHVTFGSVLTARDTGGQLRFRDRLVRTLQENEDAHYQAVTSHLARHIAPFASK